MSTTDSDSGESLLSFNESDEFSEDEEEDIDSPINTPIICRPVSGARRDSQQGLDSFDTVDLSMAIDELSPLDKTATTAAAVATTARMFHL
jgi:hypothetical protein